MEGLFAPPQVINFWLNRVTNFSKGRAKYESKSKKKKKDERYKKKDERMEQDGMEMKKKGAKDKPMEMDNMAKDKPLDDF